MQVTRYNAQVLRSQNHHVKLIDHNSGDEITEGALLQQAVDQQIRLLYRAYNGGCCLQVDAAQLAKVAVVALHLPTPQDTVLRASRGTISASALGHTPTDPMNFCTNMPPTFSAGRWTQ